ncbi:MAG: hypothetical protein ABII27_01600 [bacterium]
MTVRKTRRSADQKFIDWVSVQIPESFYLQVIDFLKETRKYASPSEFIRIAVAEKLRAEYGIKKKGD